jgi:transposase
MRGRKSPLKVALTEEQIEELQRYIRSRNMKAGYTRRARAVFLVATTHNISYAARMVGLNRRIVRYWVSRFIKEGFAGLEDKPGRGRKPKLKELNSRKL